MNDNGAIVDFNSRWTVDDGTKDGQITIKSFFENSWNNFNWMWN